MGEMGFFGQHFKPSHMMAPPAQFASTHMGFRGGWVLGTCPDMYHPQCIIPFMVQCRHCVVLNVIPYGIICNVQLRTFHVTTMGIPCLKCIQLKKK
jgi:hypothetical protein